MAELGFTHRQSESRTLTLNHWSLCPQVKTPSKRNLQHWRTTLNAPGPNSPVCSSAFPRPFSVPLPETLCVVSHPHQSWPPVWEQDGVIGEVITLALSLWAQLYLLLESLERAALPSLTFVSSSLPEKLKYSSHRISHLPRPSTGRLKLPFPLGGKQEPNEVSFFLDFLGF